MNLFSRKMTETPLIKCIANMLMEQNKQFEYKHNGIVPELIPVSRDIKTILAIEDNLIIIHYNNGQYLKIESSNLLIKSQELPCPPTQRALPVSSKPHRSLFSLLFN